MELPDFGTKLIDVRKAKGLTQEEVAEKCKITVRTIQRIESGHVKPRAFTIKTISEALGFDFFVASNTGYEANKVNQNPIIERNNSLWYLKDLFNLKTNAMKKISILTTTVLIIGIGLFAFSSKVFSQQAPDNSSITIHYNNDKSVRRIEVRFSTNLTFDSLVNIKNVLKTYDIRINYKKIEFDKSNHLTEISCDAFTKMGNGSLHMPLLNSKNAGFFCDYSKGAKPAFCIGGCDL